MAKIPKPFFFSSFLLAGDGEDLGKEFQVLKTGTYKHPRYGTINITPTDLVAFKENFDKGVRGIDIAVNYEHGFSVAHGTKAAGWIRSLAIKNNGTELWATPEWTPDALKAIQDKEWRYSSAEIEWAWEHPETGVTHRRVLTGAALTNVPFIKGMQAIAAHDLELPDNDTRGDHMKLSEIIAMLLAEHGINLTDLQDKAKLVPDLQAKVAQLSEAAGKDKERIKTLETENAALTQKVDLSEKAALDVQVKALCEKGMKEGKLTKVFAEGHFSALVREKGVKFGEEMLAGMPKVIDVGGEKGHGGGEGGEKTFSDPAAEIVRLSEELMIKNKALSFSEAQSMVRKANPDLDKAYKKAALAGNANADD